MLLSPLVMSGPHGLAFLKSVELCLMYCDPKTSQNKSLGIQTISLKEPVSQS